MKKVLSLVVVFATLVAFTSCKKANGPEAVAESYLKAIAKMDYTAAKKMVTEESVATIEMLESLAGMSGEAGVDVTVKDMKCEVKENDAVCTCVVVKGDEEESETVELKNIDGNWLVHQPKETPGDDDLFDFDEEEEEIVEAEIEEVVEDVVE